MVSVERIRQFTNIPSEAAWRIKDCLPTPHWPAHGDIHIRALEVIVMLIISLFIFLEIIKINIVTPTNIIRKNLEYPSSILEP